MILNEHNRKSFVEHFICFWLIDNVKRPVESGRFTLKESNFPLIEVVKSSFVIIIEWAVTTIRTRQHP